METRLYPEQHEALLRKAGLILSGKLIIKAVRTVTVQSRSEDGLSWSDVKRITGDDMSGGKVISTITVPVRDKAGRIKGYWANGLTTEEKEIIHNECGVPYYYLGNPVNAMTGKQDYPDSQLYVHDDQEINLEDPKDVAFFLILSQVVSTIGVNEKEAKANDAMFYFFSVEEKIQEERDLMRSRKNAIALIDKLNEETKEQYFRILAFEKSLMSDPFISKAAAVNAFDQACFDIPFDVLTVHQIVNKDIHLAAAALLYMGYIEASGVNGPYYTNADVVGTREHIGDSFDEMLKKLPSFPKLMKHYETMLAVNSGKTKSEVLESAGSKVLHSLLEKHKPKELVPMGSQQKTSHGAAKVADEEDDEELTYEEKIRNKVRTLNGSAMLNLFRQEGIIHTFTTETPVREMREFYIEYMSNK